MKDNLYSSVFKLLQVSLSGQDSDDKLEIDNDMSEKLFEISVLQGVTAIIFDAMNKIAGRKGQNLNELLDEDQILFWIYSVDKIEKHYKFHYLRARHLAELYYRNGIRTIVLKGLAISKDYPIPCHRPCGDLDIFLPDAYEKGNKIVERKGATVDTSWYRHSHIKYKSLTVENHKFLTLVRGNKKIRGLEKILNNLLYHDLEKIDGTHLECPPPMFTALFLTYHAQRHYLTEGISLRHLCDWAMFIKNHGREVDWQYFNEVCREYGMIHFANAMSTLAGRIIGIELPADYIVPVDEQRTEELKNDILYGMQFLYSANLSKWKKNFQLIKNLRINSRRYKLFADESYMKEIFRLIYGFLFDRNPKAVTIR